MQNQSAHKADGFYSAYFAGVAGNSFAIFVFQSGVITGADAGGGIYDGTFSITPDGKYIEGIIKFTLSVGGVSITGADGGDEGLSMEVPLRLPVDFSSDEVFRIETPVGPINAKFVKIRGI